jgi:CheY-like chemotaxis protein
MDVRPIVVAVFDSSPDTVDMLRLILEREGFVVVSAFTYELRDGKVDIEAFVRQHAPRVIVYDIAPPYEQNWRLFEHLRSIEILRHARFVVTTTNAAEVRKIAVSTPDLHEIVGKPYDLGLIADAVKDAARQDQPAPPSR